MQYEVDNVVVAVVVAAVFVVDDDDVMFRCYYRFRHHQYNQLW